MKKFFGIISTFFALIQFFFFWFCFVCYITHLNQFGHILSHVGFWIITYIILFIFSIFLFKILYYVLFCGIIINCEEKRSDLFL